MTDKERLDNIKVVGNLIGGPRIVIRRDDFEWIWALASNAIEAQHEYAEVWDEAGQREYCGFCGKNYHG